MLVRSFASMLGAVAPVFLLIGLGHVLRRRGFPGEGFWEPAERLTYYVLFPALLVNNLAGARLGELQALPLGGVFVASLLIAAGVLLATRRLARTDGPGFSSVFQGGVRMNTYIALAGAAALYGEPGLTLAAVGLASIIPLVNVLSVAVLSRHGSGHRGGWGATLSSLVRNPLIVACVVGIGLNAAGLALPAIAAESLRVLGRASLTLGLLTVGAGLELRGMGAKGPAVALSATVKLVVLPLLAAQAASLLGVEGAARGVAILFSAVPCSVSSYILARQMGGDAPLMATILTFQTALAAATLPAALALLA